MSAWCCHTLPKARQGVVPGNEQTRIEHQKQEMVKKRTNIIKFPRGGVDPPVASTRADTKRDLPRDVKSEGFFAALIRCLWVVVVLVWPVLKWLISVEVFFQAIRAIYYWDKPDVHAGWTFLLHFAVLTIITYFVSAYKPKNMLL